MSDRRNARWMGIDPRRQAAKGGPGWLVIAAVRPWVLPMFEPRGTPSATKMSRRPGDEPTDRVRQMSWSGRDFQRTHDPRRSQFLHGVRAAARERRVFECRGRLGRKHRSGGQGGLPPRYGQMQGRYSRRHPAQDNGRLTTRVAGHRSPIA
jgi:hypothetical protein